MVVSQLTFGHDVLIGNTSGSHRPYRIHILFGTEVLTHDNPNKEPFEIVIPAFRSYSPGTDETSPERAAHYPSATPLSRHQRREQRLLFQPFYEDLGPFENPHNSARISRQRRNLALK